MLPREVFLDFNSSVSPCIQTGYFLTFQIIFQISVGKLKGFTNIYCENLTDFRKTVGTGVDPRLDTVLQARDRGKGIAVATPC